MRILTLKRYQVKAANHFRKSLSTLESKEFNLSWNEAHSQVHPQYFCSKFILGNHMDKAKLKAWLFGHVA